MLSLMSASMLSTTSASASWWIVHKSWVTNARRTSEASSPTRIHGVLVDVGLNLLVHVGLDALIHVGRDAAVDDSIDTLVHDHFRQVLV